MPIPALLKLGYGSRDNRYALIIQNVISFSVSAAECNRDFGSEGVIETPNFPFYYGMDLNCAWTIEAPPGFSVVLDLTSFRLAGPVQPIKVLDPDVT